MTNSVSASTFDVATVVGSTEGAIDGFDYVDGLPGLIDHPRAGRVPAGAPLVVTGWALDRSTRGAAAAVRVVVDGIQQHEARTGLSRSDIVQMLDRPPGDERIGFRALVPTDGLPAGAHVVRAYALCAGGRWYDAGRCGFSVYEPLRPGAGATTGAVRLHVDQVIDVDRRGGIVAFGDAVPAGRFAMLSGWALDVAAGTGPAAVCATDDRGNRWTAPCELGRPDIRALMGAADERLGFELCIPARVLGRGRHVVRLGAVDHDGRPSEAALDVTVDVAAEQRPFPHGAHERAGTPEAACRLSFAPGPARGEPVLADLTGEDAVAIPRGAIVAVAGWALASNSAAATDVFLELSIPGVAGTPHRHGAVAGFRRDAPPRGLPAPPVPDAWFACSFGTDELSPRRYRLELVVAESGRRALVRRPLGYLDIADPAHPV